MLYLVWVGTPALEMSMNHLDKLLADAEETYRLADGGCRINPEPFARLIAIVKRQRKFVETEIDLRAPICGRAAKCILDVERIAKGETC